MLLLQRAKYDIGRHKWYPPAGKMEDNEDPIGTALRETKEEIGVDVELIDLIGIRSVPYEGGGTAIGFVFRGRIVSGRIKLQAAEIENYRYFWPEELDDLIEKDMLHKPEFNVPNIRDWRAGKSFPLGVIRRFEKKAP